MSKSDNNIIIYQDEDGITKVNVRFVDEDIWLNQNQIAEIYKTTQENISMHIRNIYKEQELNNDSTNKKFLLVQNEGNRQVKRNIDHYNLDMIIALGYRVQLQRLNLLVSQFLDFAELQALEQREMTMKDWINELDNQIVQNKRKLLEDNGKISHKEAIEKAQREFEIYRDREMRQLESDFDKMMKMLNESNK